MRSATSPCAPPWPENIRDQSSSPSCQGSPDGDAGVAGLAAPVQVFQNCWFSAFQSGCGDVSLGFAMVPSGMRIVALLLQRTIAPAWRARAASASVAAMTQPETGGTPPPAPDARVPRGTTPTWEIEMLLSGAVVFALMQVPGALDSTFDRLFLRLDGTFGIAALLVYSYTKAIVYALILTFLFHLAARAYWI